MSLLTVFVTTIAFTLPIFTAQAAVSKLEESLINQLINPQTSGAAAAANANGVNGSPLNSKNNGDQGSYLHNYSNLLDTLAGSPPSRSTLLTNRLSSVPSQWFLLEYPLTEVISDKRTSQSFTPWAGKRSRSFEEGKRVFHSWAGKRAVTRPFSNWAGKRAVDDDSD